MISERAEAKHDFKNMTHMHVFVLFILLRAHVFITQFCFNCTRKVR